jgi:hypothetical protein
MHAAVEAINQLLPQVRQTIWNRRALPRRVNSREQLNFLALAWPKNRQRWYREEKIQKLQTTNTEAALSLINDDD